MRLDSNLSPSKQITSMDWQTSGYAMMQEYNRDGWVEEAIHGSDLFRRRKVTVQPHPLFAFNVMEIEAVAQHGFAPTKLQ